MTEQQWKILAEYIIRGLGQIQTGLRKAILEYPDTGNVKRATPADSLHRGETPANKGKPGL